MRRWLGVRWPFWLIAVLLAQPLFQVFATIAIVGMIFAFIVAAICYLGPVYVAIAAAMDRFLGPAGRLQAALSAWLELTLLWAATAFGISRMGDVGRTMGFRNMPYHEAFFGPISLLRQVLS